MIRDRGRRWTRRKLSPPVDVARTSKGQRLSLLTERRKLQLIRLRSTQGGRQAMRQLRRICIR